MRNNLKTLPKAPRRIVVKTVENEEFLDYVEKVEDWKFAINMELKERLKADIALEKQIGRTAHTMWAIEFLKEFLGEEVDYPVNSKRVGCRSCGSWGFRKDFIPVDENQVKCPSCKSTIFVGRE